LPIWFPSTPPTSLPFALDLAVAVVEFFLAAGTATPVSAALALLLVLSVFLPLALDFAVAVPKLLLALLCAISTFAALVLVIVCESGRSKRQN
jgi:hypothetical protein